MAIYSQIDVAEKHQVAVWRIDESVEELLGLVDITDADKKVLDAFKLEKRKKEWLASRLLLQKLIGQYPHIVYNSNGKPQLQGDQRFISISHTNRYAAVSVSQEPTALDIEICSGRVDKVANRFVHNDEQTYIKAGERTQFLTVLWCAKEALYKYYDIYGVVFKEQFRVKPFQLGKTGKLDCTFIHEARTKENSLTFEINDEYTLVYC
ncbi:4'-phosphopantetheinyl transferase family protein [Carboxylicivirga marina]|uniref:4'-phosphopantetheinyl transferase superfamily protein n=1 Tax=Carboxylicivirga marina TaxID=2800988 RepID=A0ABS1HKH0_9BACT|nr:4'-phosphopantetheinyl transferase family protein [Carboxylicivirga marina]MBK3518168.1 4'-phosphopantetheinyl transferase superfamily protein [Carboxylicivirga marina]